MKKVLFALIAVFVGLATVLFLTAADSDRQARIDHATTPEQLAVEMLSNGKTQATLNNGVLTISYTVNWVLSAGTAVSGFNVNTARLMPAIFAKFPQVKSIIFRESGPFNDIRGNETTEEMLRIAFMRQNSESIRWDKINYDNVPKLGEGYWIHPGLRRQLQD